MVVNAAILMGKGSQHKFTMQIWSSYIIIIIIKIIIIIIIISWCYGPLKAKACQPTAGLTSTSSLSELNIACNFIY